MDLLQCLPALNASQGITANPDISGIGVRTAIYIQAALSLVHPLIAGYDGKIDDFELQSLATVYLGILLPGCALVLSAIIQARTFGLSAYHAMIVLFLSWINNTSALTFFTYILGDGVYSRQYQECEESERQSNRRHEVTELDHEWVEAVDLEKWRVLEKVEKMMDRLKSDKNGTKSTSLSREMWELEIQQWSLWRKKKIMSAFLPNEADGLEFQRRWEEDWENNKRKQLEVIWPNPPRSNWNSLDHLFSQKSFLLMGALASTHLTLLSGFGWWFWSTLPNFGINQECIPSIRFVFFTKSIPITSKTFRSRFKSIYIFSSLPAINIVIWINIFLCCTFVFLFMLLPFLWVPHWIQRMRRKWVHRKVPSSSQPVSAEEGDDSWFPRLFFTCALITTLAAQAFLMTLTELTIAHNQPLIQSKEGDWTFGQTLALTLTLIPLIEVIKFLWEKRPRAPKESGEDMETKETGGTAEALEPGEVRESGEHRGETEADVLV